MADGRLEILEKKGDPSLYVPLGKKTKKLDDMLHPTYAERTTYYEANKHKPDYSMYDEERARLRAFAKTYGLRYHEGLRWKPGHVAEAGDCIWKTYGGNHVCTTPGHGSHAKPPASLAPADLKAEVDRVDADVASTLQQLVAQGLATGRELVADLRKLPYSLAQKYAVLLDRQAQLRRTLRTAEGVAMPDDRTRETYDEAKHPRDDDGQWTASGGGGGEGGGDAPAHPFRMGDMVFNGPDPRAKGFPLDPREIWKIVHRYSNRGVEYAKLANGMRTKKGVPLSALTMYESLTSRLARETMDDVEVTESELVPVRISEMEVLDGATPLTGSKWAVRILRFGRSLNGWVWDEQSGRALLPHLNFAPVAVFASPSGFMGHSSAPPNPHGPPLRNVVGHIEEAVVKPDGVYGTFAVNDDAQWVRDRLLGLQSQGTVGKTLGLSVDALASYLPTTLREGVGKVIRAVKQVFSVDLVSNPSADGRVLRAVAGLSSTPEEETTMSPRMLDILKKTRPELLEGRAVEAMTDEQVDALLAEALATPGPKPPPAPHPGPHPTPRPAPHPAPEPHDPPGPGPEARRPIVALDPEPAWLAAARIREARAMVREAVDAAGFPPAVRAQLLARFDGKTPDPADVESAVKEAKALLASITPTGDVNAPGGGTRFEVGAEPVDKYQAAMDALFDVTRESFDTSMKATHFTPETIRRVSEGVNKNPASGDAFRFRGIREAYITMTGDAEYRMSPRLARVKEATTATWADILGNTLYRRMLMDYAEQQYNEATIATFGRADDFKTKQVVIGGYFVDLAAVAEAGPYVAIADPADEKVSYAVTKRGNLFEITMEVIANDDMQWVRRAVGRLGRAARHTLAAYVWGMWNGVGVLYDVDGVAWFDAAHGNTGATALTGDLTGANEVYVKVQQLAAMTEPTSGNKLGFPPSAAVWLDIPIGLSAIASTLNNAVGYGATLANNLTRGMFGPNDNGFTGGIRINANPIFSDATDWGVHIDVRSGGRESIVVDFYQGRQEPEMFLANQETVGAMFTNDKIQYKIRHIYGGDLVDFRGAAKNVVA